MSLRALLAACKGNTFEARRDTALLRLLVSTGARVSELTGLSVDDIDLDTREATVMGKGDRTRCGLPLSPKADFATSTATCVSGRNVPHRTCPRYL